MDAGTQKGQPSFSVGRQALIAIIVSLLSIGAIWATGLADDDNLDSAVVSPSAATSQTTAVPSSVADEVLPTSPPGGSVVVETSTAVVESTESIPPAETIAPAAAESTATSTVTATGLPAVDAKAFAVYDATAQQWLAESAADTPMPVGSVMKLLTSYVVLGAGDLTQVVTVPQLNMDIAESAIGVYEGEQLPRDVLLRAMLVVSANDAARALAIDVGGSTDGFVDQMNSAAAALGLNNTVAVNPVGLDAEGAQSSARDMVSLAALLMENPTFSAAVAKPSASLHGQTFAATNKLLASYEGATGVKTGHTTGAGYCLVGSATRGGRTIIVAVLGSPSDAARLSATTALLDWAFAQS